jgi:hypothetical protein
LDDLLVVMAVMAAATAIVVVGLLQTRESARRAQCVRNLRQLRLALQAYHQTFGMLPSAAVRLGPGTTVKLENHTSARENYSLYQSTANWAVLLLPHLGEEELAVRFDPGALVTDEANAEARGTEMPLMICPDDSFHRSDNCQWARADDSEVDIAAPRDNANSSCVMCRYTGAVAM